MKIANLDSFLNEFQLELANEEIQPGDLYIGKRNTINLLTCKYVDKENQYVVPTTFDYPFNISECIKLKDKNKSLTLKTILL